jgi:hypothetical protein
LKPFRFSRLLAAVPGLCVWLLSSRCAGPQALQTTSGGTDPYGTDPYSLFREVREHAARLGTFEGRAVWTAISEDGSFRGTSRITLKSPDSLWMKVEGPFGIDAAFLSFTPGRILFYSPMMRTAFSGEPGNTRLADVMPLGTIAMILGASSQAAGLLVPGDTLLENLTAFKSEKKGYVLDFDTGDRIRIEKKGPVVSRWEKQDTTGAVTWLWEAERFQGRGGIRLPLLIRLDIAGSRSFTLFYETVKTNSVLRKGWCDVRIPESVEIKPL